MSSAMKGEPGLATGLTTLGALQSTPFHSCVEVRSPKLVSSEDRTGARAPSPSYCSTEEKAPLHTAPPVPVHCATSAGSLRHQFHCATSAGSLRHQCRYTAPPVPVHCATSAGALRHQCRYTAPPVLVGSSY